ncbi:MAG: hypothetical protein ACRDI1_05690 [Actinomycetota bacterium]
MLSSDLARTIRQDRLREAEARRQTAGLPSPWRRRLGSLMVDGGLALLGGVPLRPGKKRPGKS